MKIVRNSGTDRVIDLLRPELTAGRRLDVVTPNLSLFAFSELLPEVTTLANCRLIVPPASSDLELFGSDADRAARNRLQTRWLAGHLANWLQNKAEVRRAAAAVPQGTLVVRDSGAQPLQALLGSLAFSTAGLGLTPGNPLSLIQASETPAEALLLSQWFDTHWSSLLSQTDAKPSLITLLQSLAEHRPPFLIYTLILHHIFRDRGDDLDEENPKEGEHHPQPQEEQNHKVHHALRAE